MRRWSVVGLCLLLLAGCQSAKTPEIITPAVNSVYYEIYVGSFYDSDGDGSGDLLGVVEKLDYLQQLGVTTLWLMPIHPSPTYHKYDVVDYYGIDEAYGTLDDFKILIEQLDRRNISLILDLVLNHTSTKHPWFLSAVSGKINDTCDQVVECGYYNFQTIAQPNYHALTNDLYYEGVFWDQMPDLNLDNQELRDEILNITQYWFDLGVDGFRLDATTHFYQENVEKNIAFLSWFNQAVKQQNPQAYLVGEAWTSDAIIQQMYASGLDSFFNFGASQNAGMIVKSINRSDGYGLAQYVGDYQAKIESYNEDAVNAVFLSNHDNNRSAGYLGSDIQKQKLAASIYLMMPGNVYIYYGEEIGMKGSGIDENKRLPMPWAEDDEHIPDPPAQANYLQEQPTTVEEALAQEDSLFNHYQKVLRARNSYESISRGDFVVMDYGDKALYVIEYDDIVIVHNLSAKNILIPIEYKDTISLNGQVIESKDGIELEGYTSVIVIKP